jgi:hypothetical protein
MTMCPMPITVPIREIELVPGSAISIHKLNGTEISPSDFNRLSPIILPPHDWANKSGAKVRGERAIGFRGIF